MNDNMNENRLSLRGKTKNMSTGVWAIFQKTGRIICLGGVAVALSFAMACSNAETDIGTNWRYTGEELWNVFNEARSDEGAIYVVSSRHGSWISMYLPITVMQATKKGNLVQCGKGDKQLDGLIWVVSPGKRYLDGEPLRDGYYIRRGSYEYTNVRGAECTVARYVEVTDKNVLLEIEKAQQELMAQRKAEEEAREAKRIADEAQRKAEEEAREAMRKAEEEARKKAREDAAEQGAYELDIPIKSLCGFKLGVPPSQVGHLLQNDDGTPVQDFVGKVLNGGYSWGDDGVPYSFYQCKYRLVKPFRLFTHAQVTFYEHGVGLHLASVRLIGDVSNVSKESYVAEVLAVVKLIEKKFGIKLHKLESKLGYSWYGGDAEIEISVSHHDGDFLVLEYSFWGLNTMDKAVIKARKESGKTAIVLDADAGADDL